MVTAKHRTRAFSGHGTIKILADPTATPDNNASHLKDRWDLVLASVKGTVHVPATCRTLLYEQSAGETVVHNGNNAHHNLYNLTAELSLLSREYLIEYFNNGRLHRGPDVPWWMGAANYWLCGILLMEVGIYWAVVVPMPGATKPVTNAATNRNQATISAATKPVKIITTTAVNN